MNKFYVTAIIAIIAFSACKKDKVGDNPTIYFDSLSKNILKSGVDAFSITMRYSIPTSNLLGDPSSANIYFKQNRDSFDKVENLEFPEELRSFEIPENRDHIRGYITFILSADAYNLALRPSRPNGDTLTFDIWIEDPSGRRSNTITTSEVYIIP